MTDSDRKRAIDAVDAAVFQAICAAFQRTLDDQVGSWIGSDSLTEEIERITDARMIAVAAIEAMADVAP